MLLSEDVAEELPTASFTLNGEDYQLPVNNGSNHLHGGFNSFSRKVWLAVVDDKVPNTVLFMLDSPDGDEAIPEI